MSVMMRGKVLSFVTTIEIGETIRIAFADNISMDGLDLDYSSSFLTTMLVRYTKRDEEQGMVAYNVCVIKNVVSEEKTRFSYKFQTNDRMELIIDNTDIICSLRIIDGNLGNIKQVAVSTPVHSFSYG
ncbi:uncharacterized protein LOC132713343 [Ruditapes philippinarum]|uniref:uncharacterized protein LOC132713343 n=1 Tax=Ruditapes philippinarum TaxID=129788 RepID=UPI00295A67D5|nr:uncharacterized protein LOC132713343 [Ruditapes philippinarum]